MTPGASTELARARQMLGSTITEDDYQRDIVKAAKLLGWRAYHTLDSRGSAAGYPDLTLLRGRRLVFAEIKREKGQATDDQQAWLAELGQVTEVTAYLWRPSDWDDVEAVLR